MATELPGAHLVDRDPQVSAQQMLAELVPPREFEKATFENYLPDPLFPSQAVAVEICRGTAKTKSFFNRTERASGVYLDGGFGVGKTHLLAGLYANFSGTKLFGSFLAYTSLVGALGFAQAQALLSKYQLICIDEFELDDPGNTMIMSRLLNELSQVGVLFAATSNTPPNALGEGRFASSDFQREIQGIGSKFTFVRVDGEDYRHRDPDQRNASSSEDELADFVGDGNEASSDSFKDLLAHLSKLHPSKYSHLLDGISRVAILDSFQLVDEFDALRFVAFVDRAYEAQVRIRSTGVALTNIFPSKFIEGAYRKKNLRAISRLGAMSNP
jgi:cell division protein ZapE